MPHIYQASDERSLYYNQSLEFGVSQSAVNIQKFLSGISEFLDETQVHIRSDCFEMTQINPRIETSLEGLMEILRVEENTTAVASNQEKLEGVRKGVTENSSLSYDQKQCAFAKIDEVKEKLMLTQLAVRTCQYMRDDLAEGYSNQSLRQLSRRSNTWTHVDRQYSDTGRNVPGGREGAAKVKAYLSALRNELKHAQHLICENYNDLESFRENANDQDLKTAFREMNVLQSTVQHIYMGQINGLYTGLQTNQNLDRLHRIDLLVKLDELYSRGQTCVLGLDHYTKVALDIFERK